MLTVHHLGVSQSERIIWLCEELGLTYTLKRYDRDPVTRLAPAAYKALHPLGTAPVIEDDGLVLAESGAIVDYIVARHGGGRLAVAPDHPDFAQYLFWLHFANGSLMPSLMMGMVMTITGAPASPATGFITARIDTALRLVDQRLGQSPYLAGEAVTAADIMSVFPLTTMRVFTGRDLSGLPHIAAYLSRIGERPAYQAAMAKGEPGMPPMLG